VSEALESVIDEATLDELRQLDDEDGGFLEEVVQAYVQDAHVLLDDLRAGIGCGNAKKTARAAHSLKTPSFQVGALGLGELCRQVEEKSRGGSCEGLESLLQAIAAQVVAVSAALTTQIEASTRPDDEPSGS
jgi:HPt (histidine-containing phosphotransfer) domain-containing protein